MSALVGDRVYANVWYVLPSGNDTTGNGSISTPYASISKACTVAGAGDAILFNGLIDETTSSARRIALPAGVHLIGASRATARVNLDWNTTDDNPFQVAVYAADNCTIENCTFAGVAAAGAYQLMLGYSSSDPAASVNVVVRNVRIVGDSDGFYFRSTTGTGRWKVYDCVVETKYDATQMIGTNANQEVNFYNCDFAALAPSLASPAQATTRAITATIGITRCYGCRFRAETTDGTTPKVECIHASSAGGIGSRIELYNCTVTTRVTSGYAGTHTHLRCDSTSTLIVVDTSYDSTKTAGTITSQNVADGSVVEIGVTNKQAMRAILAFARGNVAFAGTGTEVFYAPDGSTARLTFTVDINGNRTCSTNL